MKKSIATISLGGTLAEKLAAIAAAGFDGIELVVNDLPIYRGAAAEIRHAVAELGLSIDLFQPIRDFEGTPEELWPGVMESALRALDLARMVAAPLVLVCSNTRGGFPPDDRRAEEQLRTLAGHAAERGLKIGYEALAWGTHVRTFDQAWRLVQRVDHPAFGLILDSFHVLALPNDWSGIAKLPGARIFHLQVGDAPRLDIDPLTLRRQHCDIPGRGDMDVAGFVRAVLRTGYAGILALEVFNTVSVPPARTGALEGFTSLLRLEEQVGRAAPS
jgi:4-hydroxyphenylpyruvate dioxygenase